VANLTLVFATFDGAHTLPRLLDALERQSPPAGGWKVVAIDNGGRRGAGRLLRERSNRLPMTVVTEARRGKSAALNAGLSEIEGDLVVFTDDDVVPPPDWLVSLRALADARRGYDIFGGAVEPIWPFEPPDWVLRCASKGYFAWTHFDEGPVAPTAVWGPNMAVRRVVLQGRRFCEGIGPNGTASYPVGSETEFLMRAATIVGQMASAARTQPRPGSASSVWPRAERRSAHNLGYPSHVGGAVSARAGGGRQGGSSRRVRGPLSGSARPRRSRGRSHRAPSPTTSAQL